MICTTCGRDTEQEICPVCNDEPFENDGSYADDDKED